MIIITAQFHALGFFENIYQHSPVFFQNFLVSAYGYHWKQRRFGGTFKPAYHAARERENFSHAQWNAYQEQQLRQLTAHAFEHVPYYRQAFLNKGVTLQQLKQLTVADLHTLPVLSKEILRKFGSTSLLSARREPGGSFLFSSGSTGTPVRILYSPAMHQRWFALFEARIRNWAGVTSFVPRGMIGGRRIVPQASAHPPFYRYNFFEKQVYFSAYHINAANASNYLEGMKKHGVTYMTGYAMSNFFLTRFFKELQLEAPQLKAVLPSSEKLTPEMRQMFFDVYGCKTFDSWGSVEACGMVSECEHGSLHINPDAGLIELLDDELKPIKAGQPGTVYCTGFLNYDQPLIRYAIGDRMVASDKSCACGRAMPVVEEIGGRTEDTIIGKDGREMVRFHSVFYGLEKIKQAQVIQEDAGVLVIKIVADNQLAAADEKLIISRIESQLGDVQVTIQRVPFISLTANGKFQAVVSKIKRTGAHG